MKNKKFILTILSGLCMLFIVGMTDSMAGSTVVFNLNRSSKSIDPQLVTGITGAQVDAACIEGLTRVKQAGHAVPAAAKSWKVSKDGTVYTFYLRKDAKWSNGQPVTAHDFLFGMKRTLMPSTASQYGYYLYNIKNAEAYNTGKIKDFNKVGIKALNPYTLQITLNAPCTYFPQIVSGSPTMPCNEAFFNKVNKNYALTPKDMIYNGPWELTQWITGAGGKYVFKKNPYYWNKKNIKIDNLVYDLVADPNTSAAMFRTGQIDLTHITANQIPQFKNSNELLSVPAGGIMYLEFNLHNKYLKNLKIRKAISLAINRTELCNYIIKNGSKPAYALVPPGTKGPDNKGFRQVYGSYNIKVNIKEAKKLFAEGLKELGVKPPIHLKLLLDNSGIRPKICVFIQQQLKKNLGLDVAIDVETFQGRLVKMQQHNFDMVFGGWIPDYNDPMTYMNLFVTGGGNNDPQFSNKEYDKLISEATVSPNNDKRMADMHKAEEILIKNAPIVPLFYPYASFLKKTWLKGVVFNPSASLYWAYIEK